MKVECIEGCGSLLTVGQTYEASVGNYSDMFTIKDNTGCKQSFYKNRFKIIEEARPLKVQCIDVEGRRDYLTLGYTYEVLQTNEDTYFLICDKHFSIWAYKNRFKIIEETNQMQVDVKKLEQSINNMKSVCANGKKEIKALFVEAFGVKFVKEKPELKAGMVLKDLNNTKLYIVFSPYGSKDFSIMSSDTGFTFSDTSTRIIERYKENTLPLLALSVEDWKNNKLWEQE